jgi:hypothetical protein
MHYPHLFANLDLPYQYKTKTLQVICALVPITLILYINSLGLPVCDMTFCCIIIFYVSAAEPAIGKSIFVWNWHPRETHLISTQLSVRPSVRPSVCDRVFQPVNGLFDADFVTPQK